MADRRALRRTTIVDRRSPIRLVRITVEALLATVLLSDPAAAQSWSFDARTTALGGVSDGGSPAVPMVPKQPDYKAMPLPFGAIQDFSNLSVYKTSSPGFNPVSVISYIANPSSYVVGRDTLNPGETAFVSDLRNATLSSNLSRYQGFVPANALLAEGLLAPHFGGTIKVHTDPSGAFQGIYLGVGPYLSDHVDATVDPELTTVLSTGVNIANAALPINTNVLAQMAIAVTGGYRGRLSWPGAASGSGRDGLYFAVNYNYLRGFLLEDDALSIQLKTDNAGLVSNSSDIVIDHQHATSGMGSSVDLGVIGVKDRWQVGFGARGLGNRITWTGVEQTTYTLASVTSGITSFLNAGAVPAADLRVQLPVDYRGTVAYADDMWSAVVQGGHGFGGALFHGGLERRFRRVAVRGGATYSFSKWNPTSGVGFDLSRSVAIDVAAYGTTANIELKRQLAIGVSLRFTRPQ